MMTPKLIREISSEIAKGRQLKAVLSKHGVPPLLFFNYLDSSPADKLLFEKARQVSAELLLDEVDQELDLAEDKFALEKAKAKISFRSWLAEKLIPSTYGQRVDVNVNQTIDIRQTLADAKARAHGAIPTTAKPVEALDAPSGDELIGADAQILDPTEMLK